jgi:hypothetical protein
VTIRGKGKPGNKYQKGALESLARKLWRLASQNNRRNGCIFQMRGVVQGIEVMELKSTRTLLALYSVVLSLVVGCAAAPPAPPPTLLTYEQRMALWDRNIDEAAELAAAQGRDPATVRNSLHYNKCIWLAEHNSAEYGQRSAALAQCRIDYPQPTVVSQPVTTQCYTSNGVTQCVSP